LRADERRASLAASAKRSESVRGLPFPPSPGVGAADRPVMEYEPAWLIALDDGEGRDPCEDCDERRVEVAEL